jgi:hypothetical protein
MKEHRAQVLVLPLQSADNRIPPSDLDKTLAIDVERKRRQRLLPGVFRVDVAGAVNVTGDGVPALTYQHGRRAPPAFHRKGHGDGVADPRPAAEVARFRFEVEWSLGDDLEARDRRDEGYSSAAARLP